MVRPRRKAQAPRPKAKSADVIALERKEAPRSPAREIARQGTAGAPRPDYDTVCDPVPAAPPPASKTRKVRWTAKGEQKRAWSEHGTHIAGEIVETNDAKLLIERGFAEAI